MNNRVIDLFSGVGGMSLGFASEGFEIVLANEIDKDIADAYTKNHPKTMMINDDIKNLDIKSTFSEYCNNISGIIGGPPCQGFSQKGQRKTLKDERNYLFLYFFELVKYIKPIFFVMENVPNLLTADNGYFKNEMRTMFNNVGYSVIMDVINAVNYGVPQKRSRAFIAGDKEGRINKLFNESNSKVTVWDAISDLNYLSSGEGCFEQDYRYKPQTEYQRTLRGKSRTLFNHQATNHDSIALERMSMIPVNGGKEFLPKEHLTKSIYSGTWSRIIKDEASVTITTRFDTPASGRFMHPYLDRAITVREAARIQSFPDNFVFYGNKGSQMKQVGNAVPPLLASRIAESIKNQYLDSSYWAYG